MIEPLFAEDLVVVAHAEHPLAGRRRAAPRRGRRAPPAAAARRRRAAPGARPRRRHGRRAAAGAGRDRRRAPAGQPRRRRPRRGDRPGDRRVAVRHRALRASCACPSCRRASSPSPTSAARRPSAPTRALFDVLREVIADRRASSPACASARRRSRSAAEPGDLIALARPRRVGSRACRPPRSDCDAARRAPVTADVRVLDGRATRPAGGVGRDGRRDDVGVPRRPAVVDDRRRRRAGRHRRPRRAPAARARAGVERLRHRSRASPPWRAGAAWPRRSSTCSGVVPTVVVVDGPAVSGPALLLGVADLVVMTEASYAFVNGPVMVAEFTGVRVATDELGGAGELARHTGVPSLVVADTRGRGRRRRRPARLPARQRRRRADRAGRPTTRLDRPCPEAGELIPPISTGSYDVRQRRRGDRRRRQPARDPRPLGGQRRHRVRHHRRAPDRHRRQPAARPRRHARHPGVAEGGPVRRRCATRSTCRS